MSIAGGIAKGLQTGMQFGFGMRDRERQDKELALREREFDAREEDRRVRNQRQSELDEQGRHKLALEAIDKERSDALAMIEADARQYGDPESIPEEVRKSHQSKIADIVGRRSVMLKKFYKPLVEKETQKAQDILSGLQSGATDVRSIPAGDLVQALDVLTRRNPGDFLRGADGAPSAVEQALQQFQQGMETSNDELMLKGANFLLDPELKVGVGDPAHDGNLITGKRIARFVPDQKDPSKVYPVLEVATQRADGAKGRYLAPVTAGRTAHSDDTVAPPISMEKAFDYVGRMGVLAQILNQPDVRAKIEEGIQDSPKIDSLLRAVYAAGGNISTLTGKLKTQTMKLGDRDVLATTNESGKVVQEREYKRGVTPDVAAREEGSLKRAGIRAAAGAGARAERDLALIQEYAEENELDEEAAAAKLQEMGVIRRAGGKGPTTKAPSEAGIKGGVSGAMQQLLSDLDLKQGTRPGEYVKPNGAPATPDQITQLNAAKAAMDAAARAGDAPPQKLIQIGRKAAADKHDSGAAAGGTFEKGKTYVNAKGQQAKYGGKDAAGKDIWLKP